MPFTRTDMTNQTGSGYKANIDAATAALAGIYGKRRNVNGDGQVNQLVSAVAISNSWQYILDMWELQSSTANASGNFGQISDSNFPAGVAIGTSSFSTSAALNVSFRTKIESKNIRDIASAAAFQYPVTNPTHYFVSLSLLAYQDTGAAMNVTPSLRSADAADNFSAMTNSVAGNALSLPSGAVTLLTWEGAANALQVDTLTNFANGVCLQLDVACPNGIANKNLRIGDVQLEGGQVASLFGRASFADELERCERYYAKTFALGTAPAQNAGLVGSLFAQATGSAAGQLSTQWRFPAKMIKAPAITTYNPGAANANWRDVSGSSDVVVSVDPDTAIGADAVVIGSQTTALTAGHRCYIHAVADARL